MGAQAEKKREEAAKPAPAVGFSPAGEEARARPGAGGVPRPAESHPPASSLRDAFPDLFKQHASEHGAMNVFNDSVQRLKNCDNLGQLSERVQECLGALSNAERVFGEGENADSMSLLALGLYKTKLPNIVIQAAKRLGDSSMAGAQTSFEAAVASAQQQNFTLESTKSLQDAMRGLNKELQKYGVTKFTEENITGIRELLAQR